MNYRMNSVRMFRKINYRSQSPRHAQSSTLCFDSETWEAANPMARKRRLPGQPALSESGVHKLTAKS
jgi:hypothetical protein